MKIRTRLRARLLGSLADGLVVKFGTGDWNGALPSCTLTKASGTRASCIMVWAVAFVYEVDRYAPFLEIFSGPAALYTL